MKIESRFYTVSDVQRMMGCGRTKAYEIIRKLNEEWEKRGKLAVSGKVNRTIFDEFFPR